MPSRFREMRFSVSALHSDYKFLERSLLERPNARIIHILTDEPKGRKGFVPVFESDGSPFIDEFGYQLYIGKEVDWQGTMTDIDERYEENQLPF